MERERANGTVNSAHAVWCPTTHIAPRESKWNGPAGWPARAWRMLSPVNKNSPEFGCVEVRVIREDSVSEVVDGRGKFNAGKATSRDDKGHQRLAGGGIGFAAGALEHLDDTIANSNGVQQRFEVQRIPLDVGEI